MSYPALDRLVARRTRAREVRCGRQVLAPRGSSRKGRTWQGQPPRPRPITRRTGQHAGPQRRLQAAKRGRARKTCLRTSTTGAVRARGLGACWRSEGREPEVPQDAVVVFRRPCLDPSPRPYACPLTASTGLTGLTGPRPLHRLTGSALACAVQLPT
jgi:hypothetical protein